MQTTHCPLCKKNDTEVVSTISDRNVPSTNVLCKECGLVYTNPRMDEQEREAYYQGLFAQQRHDTATLEKAIARIQKKGTMKKFEEAAEYLLTFVKGEKKILEIGCSYGCFLKNLEMRGAKVQGVEPSLTEFECATKHFGLSVVNSTAEQFLATQNQEKFNGIIMHHVLEHVGDPVAVLEQLLDRLEKDGVMYLAVPDICHTHEPLDVFFQIPHLIYFSMHTLNQTVKKAGGKVIAHSKTLPKLGLHVIVARQDDPRVAISEKELQSGNSPEKIKRALRAQGMVYGMLRHINTVANKWTPTHMKSSLQNFAKKLLNKFR